MPEKITKAQRWLDLVVFLLRHRYPVTVEQIMESVPAYAADWAGEDEKRRASVRRKFERDKDELRGIGIPIESVKFTINYGAEEVDGYRLRGSDMYLPELAVETAADLQDEASVRERRGPSGVTLSAPPEVWTSMARGAYRVAQIPDNPLAPYARSALRRMGFDLPEIADSADEPYVHYLSVPNPDVAEALEALTPALLDHKEVSFDYYSIRRDEQRRRRAHPYGLIYQGGHWYLIASDPEADGLRTFRVSRMGEVEANTKKPKHPDYEVPADFELKDYVGREAWELGEDEADDVVAEVLFLPPTCWWIERQGLGEYLREDEETGGQIRAFRVRQLDPFLRWCLTFRGQARPLGPDPVVRGFRDLVERVLALYENDEGRDA